MKLSCFSRNLSRETNELFLGLHALAEEGLLVRFAVHVMLELQQKKIINKRTSYIN